MKDLKALNFENLISLISAQGLQLPENIECFLDDEKVEGHVIASVAAHQYVIRNDNWDLFVATVKNANLEDWLGVLENITVAINYRVIMEDGRDEKVIKPFGTVSDGIDPQVQTLLLERASGLLSICASKIARIAKLVNLAQERVQDDGDIIKDFDALVTFNTELGHGFGPVLCMDKIPYVFGDMETFEIQRTPFTDADKKLYLKFEHERIDAELKDLTDTIQAFLQSKLVKSSIHTEEMAINIVNAAMVMNMLDQHIRFISFGGRDNWRLSGGTTPNSARCHELLDEAVEELFELLEVIPKPEGVDYWAVDVRTLNIIGRDSENRNVGTPLEEESSIMTSRYNEGFLEMMKLRLRLIDNKICISL